MLSRTSTEDPFETADTLDELPKYKPPLAPAGDFWHSDINTKRHTTANISKELYVSNSKMSYPRSKSLIIYKEEFSLKDKYQNRLPESPRLVVIDPPEASTDEATMFPLEDDPTVGVITVRSCLAGVIQGIVGAVIGQVFIFKPMIVYLQPVFLQIMCLFCGRLLALIPGPRWWNPGPYTLKENVFSTLISSSARNVAYSILMLAAEDLYFDRRSSPLRSLGILISTQMIGYGWAGILVPVLVYPAAVIFPQVLSSAALFYTVSGEGKSSKSQLRLLKNVIAAIGLYEIIPTYIMPALQGVSFPCLAFPTSTMVTNLFGGVAPLEGLGLFELSLDWNFVGSGGPLYTPLFVQGHQVLALIITAAIFFPAYSSSWFGFGRNIALPFLSVSLFQENGTQYPVKMMTQPDGTLNQTLIDSFGLPIYTSTNVLTQMAQSLAVSASITHLLLWKWPVISQVFKANETNDKDVDPHRLVVRMSYRDFPQWLWACLLLIATVWALGICFNDSVIPAWSLLIAIALTGLLSVSMGFIWAISGYYMPLNGVCQMIGGLLFRGNALGNMWFSNYSAATTSQALSAMSDFKLGQYTHMPPVTVGIAQISGMFLGVLVNYYVLETLISSQRDVLLLPNGNGVYSGTLVQSYGASAVTWGNLSYQLYTIGGRYLSVPVALGVGLLLPIPFYLAHKIRPNKYLEEFNTPMLMGFIALGTLGATAGRTLNLLIGLASQLWARKFHSNWFYKYNYVLSAALDGGTQIAVMLLAVTVQGGMGSKLKVDIPAYFMNPPNPQPRDYCYLNPSK